MANIVPITQEAAIDLMDRYETEIKNRILNNTTLDDLFSYSTGGNLRVSSFTSTYLDLGVFNNLVGMTKFTFSFGLEASDFSTATRPRFTILIKASNDEGSLQSDYFQIQGVTSTIDHLPYYRLQDPSAGLAVPKVLFDRWTSNWKSMGQIDSKICSIIINDPSIPPTRVPLKKYTFKVTDAINTFYPEQLVGGNRSLESVSFYICLVNHAPHNSLGQPQLESGTIGVTIGLASQIDPVVDEFISSCYDFSAPCPPTCPR